MIKNRSAEKFIIQELVPESVYLARGEKAWQLIDYRLIDNLNALRTQLGVPMTINNWHVGGQRTQSGLRIPGQVHYKPYSQHTYGRAADPICEIPAQEIRDMIKEGVEIKLPHYACFEDNVSWTHMDVRNTGENKHYFFNV